MDLTALVVPIPLSGKVVRRGAMHLVVIPGRRLLLLFFAGAASRVHAF